MKRWYPIVCNAGTSNDADLAASLDAAEAYADEYEIAKSDLNTHGRIEHTASKLPGISEQRFAQLQDIESILEHLEGRVKKVLVERTRHYLEHYQRTLSDRVARDYAETSDEVQYVRDVLQRIAYVRNLFLGIMKGLEILHFQLSNVVKLRAAGLEDAEIQYGR